MKKILIITYYWPPAGGSGVQRWLKFAKYLPQFGWLPTIITTENGDYQVIDNSLLSEIPKNIKVIRTKTPTFYGIVRKILGKKSEIPYGTMKAKSDDSQLKKLLLWIRLNLIIPDARIIWNKFAFKAAVEEINKNKFDYVITTGPPHSTHLIGLKLKKMFPVKWIADFRDPWTTMGYLKSAKRTLLATKLDKRLEQKVVTNCDLVLAVSRKIISDLGNDKKMFLLRNGFDESDFENIFPTKQDNEFLINYFGTLPVESNPLIVLKAVYELRKKGIKNIKMNFYGNINEEIKRLLYKNDPEKIVKFFPYLPHEQILKLMKESSLLLLIINNVKNNEGIITGKIFEYIGAGVPILGVGPVNSEPAEILRESKAGTMFDYNDLNGIVEYLTKIYQNREKIISPDKTTISRFGRKNLTEQLVNILENYKQ